MARHLHEPHYCCWGGQQGRAVHSEQAQTQIILLLYSLVFQAAPQNPAYTPYSFTGQQIPLLPHTKEMLRQSWLSLEQPTFLGVSQQPFLAGCCSPGCKKAGTQLLQSQIMMCDQQSLSHLRGTCPIVSTKIYCSNLGSLGCIERQEE